MLSTPYLPARQHDAAILSVSVDIPARTIIIQGELDLSGLETVDDAVSILNEAYSPADIVIDLTGLTFLDVVGMNRLHRLRQTQHIAGASLFFVGTPQHVADLYSLAGLTPDAEPA